MLSGGLKRRNGCISVIIVAFSEGCVGIMFCIYLRRLLCGGNVLDAAGLCKDE